MYHLQWKITFEELAVFDTAALERIAASGGWRKALIEEGKIASTSAFDLRRLLFRLCAASIRVLPPLGKDFRRSLVAQSILDDKSSAW